MPRCPKAINYVSVGILPCASDRRCRAAPDHHAMNLRTRTRPRLPTCVGLWWTWRHLLEQVRGSVSLRLPQPVDCETASVAATQRHKWRPGRTSSRRTEEGGMAGEIAAGPAAGRCRRQRWSRLHEVDSCRAPSRRGRGGLKPVWPQAADVGLIRTSSDVREWTPALAPGGVGWLLHGDLSWHVCLQSRSRQAKTWWNDSNVR